MGSFSDNSAMNVYAQSCVDLYNKWGTMLPTVRMRTLKDALNSIARDCHMPEFDFFAGKLGGSWGQLNSQKWSIDVDIDIFSGGYPTQKEFLRAVSTIYHEARHGEQWFRCVQIVAKGTLPFPTQGLAAPSQRVVTNIGTVASHGPTAQNLSAWMFVPMTVAQQAEQMKRFFPAAMQALVTTWYNSIYGANRVYRNGVLTTMGHGGIGTYVQYINLPEEQDAWGLQRQVRSTIKQRLLGDEPIDLSDLFG